MELIIGQTRLIRIGHHHTTYFSLSRDKLCATEDKRRRRRLMNGKRLLDLHV